MWVTLIRSSKPFLHSERVCTSSPSDGAEIESRLRLFRQDNLGSSLLQLLLCTLFSCPSLLHDAPPFFLSVLPRSLNQSKMDQLQSSPPLLFRGIHGASLSISSLHPPSSPMVLMHLTSQATVDLYHAALSLLRSL
jgi:hypothetical protein